MELLTNSKGDSFRLVTKTIRVVEEIDSESFEKNYSLQQEYLKLRDQKEAYDDRVLTLAPLIKKKQDEVEDLRCGKRIPNGTYSGKYPDNVLKNIQVLEGEIANLKTELRVKQDWLSQEYGPAVEKIQSACDWWEKTAWGYLYEGPTEYIWRSE